MNRLSPPSARHAQPQFGKRGLWQNAQVEEEAADPLADLKLFATGLVGGLVFFSTYLS